MSNELSIFAYHPTIQIFTRDVMLITRREMPLQPSLRDSSTAYAYDFIVVSRAWTQGGGFHRIHLHQVVLLFMQYCTIRDILPLQIFVACVVRSAEMGTMCSGCAAEMATQVASDVASVQLRRVGVEWYVYRISLVFIGNDGLD